MSPTNHFGGTGTAPVPHSFVCDGVQYIGHLTDTQWAKLLGESTMDEQGRIILHKVKTKRMSRTVQCCAYEAANNFIQAMLGGKLEVGDKDWYQNHPLVEPSGLPQNVAVTLINDLVAPYGIGVSEVFLPIGSVVAEDWKPVLGVNPLANLDNSTSDEEYEKLFGESAEQFKLRFQSGSPCGAIVMYRASGNHASGGGHAEFIPPRGRVRDYVLALRLARLHDCVRLIPAPSYGERRQMAEVVDFASSEYAAGKTVNSLIDPPKSYVVNTGPLATGANNWGGPYGRERPSSYKAAPPGHIHGTKISWGAHSRRLAWCLGEAAPRHTCPLFDISETVNVSGYYDFTKDCTVAEYFSALLCAGSRVRHDHMGTFGASNLQLAYMYCKASLKPKSNNMMEIAKVLNQGCTSHVVDIIMDEYTRKGGRRTTVKLYTMTALCNFLMKYAVEQYDDWVEQGKAQFNPTIFDTFAYAFAISYRTLPADVLNAIYRVEYDKTLYEPTYVTGRELEFAESFHRNLGMGVYRHIMISAMLDRRDPAFWEYDPDAEDEKAKKAKKQPPATAAAIVAEAQMEMLKEETALQQAYPYN